MQVCCKGHPGPLGSGPRVLEGSVEARFGQSLHRDDFGRVASQDPGLYAHVNTGTVAEWAYGLTLAVAPAFEA